MTKTESWILLSRVEDVFQLRGRGCVVVPGIPSSIECPIQIGSVVRLRRPDGSEANTVIQGIGSGGSPAAPGTPVLLGTEIVKDDVPIGTEIWVQLACEKQKRQ
jgi:hypothetical protein